MIIAIFFTSTLVEGQNTSGPLAFSSSAIQNDSLIIERKNGQKIRLIWPYKKNIKKDIVWKQLLDDFQSDFRKVSTNIPEYNFYSISYIQNKNLVVDEVRGKETYTVNETDGMNYVKSNLCVLHGKNLKLSIEFNDKEELLQSSIRDEIGAAIEQVKNKFILSSISPERNYFSVSSSSMLPNPKPKLKFFIPLGAGIGLLKNQPYVELRPGLGLMQDKQYYFALNWNLMTQYNGLKEKTEYDSYVGLTIGTIGAGFATEVAFRVNNGIEANDGIYFRGGFNYRTRSGIKVGVDYYLSEDNENIFAPKNMLFGFHLGFGF